MTADQIVEIDRQRCRGSLHRPGCAHLGNDPTRQLCRGDAHKPNCRHLHPVASHPVGRPRKARKARSDAGVSRSIARGTGGSGTATHPTAGRADIERETTPEIGPYMGTAGPSDKDRGHLPCSTCATVEVTPGAKLSNGDPSGIGVTSAYRSAHIIGGRRRKPFGPVFASPAELHRFLDDHDCAWLASAAPATAPSRAA